MEKTIRHAIEEEEKVPMEQVTNFHEVMRREGQPHALPCRLAAFTSCVLGLGHRDR